ncbi:MAG: hypothetical protein RBS37_12430 [Bacteroidales bacterium]|nr:hypothetical protein [Bacteroidales bacterium]
MTIRKIMALSLIIMMMVAAASCEKQMLVVADCSECYADEPGSAVIKIKIREIPEYHTGITINVYEGSDTNSPLIYSFIVYNGEQTADVALNRTYTVEAVYRIDSRIYRAIDSVRPTLKYAKYDCDEPCWYIYNNIANVRLKYF